MRDSCCGVGPTPPSGRRQTTGRTVPGPLPGPTFVQDLKIKPDQKTYPTTGTDNILGTDPIRVLLSPGISDLALGEYSRLYSVSRKDENIPQVSDRRSLGAGGHGSGHRTSLCLDYRTTGTCTVK